CEHVEDEPAGRLEVSRDRAQRRAAVALRLHVEQRAERADDEREPTVDRRVAHVARTQVDGYTGELGALSRHVAPPRRAVAAVGAALSEDELEEARVRYLGRKSDLAQALRGVRDRESGMLLNGIRSRLEDAVGAREQELVQLVYRAVAERALDVTIPGTPVK